MSDKVKELPKQMRGLSEVLLALYGEDGINIVALRDSALALREAAVLIDEYEMVGRSID